MARRKRIFGCWSASGNIFVKRTQTERPTLIRDYNALTTAACCLRTMAVLCLDFMSEKPFDTYIMKIITVQ